MKAPHEELSPEGLADIAPLLQDAKRAISNAATTAELDDTRSGLVSKRGWLAGARRSLGGLGADDRKRWGRALNEARSAIEELVSKRAVELSWLERSAKLASDALDLTEVLVADLRSPLTRGHQHLVTKTRDELEDVFVGMGFSVEEGPEAESDWNNFEALNIPADHPARGMYDSFYLDLGEPETVVLRTHTSPVQVRLLEAAAAAGSAPIHAVIPGRCFRRDAPDATHLSVFHQIEGLVVDQGITFSHLAGTIEIFTAAYFGPEIKSRLRPAYFPFTEPSAEYDITCTICLGQGCRTCSATGWVELGGAGMVDPAVFEATGIDTGAWSGFAFGFGIDRCAQMRHQIADMRVLWENDVRFLRQY
ncbi:MAG: phenylalanine--tRNA ligase subunit alpha [Acidimicrobiales bacterium]